MAGAPVVGFSPGRSDLETPDLGISPDRPVLAGDLVASVLFALTVTGCGIRDVQSQRMAGLSLNSPGLHIEHETSHEIRAFAVMGFQQLVPAFEDVDFQRI